METPEAATAANIAAKRRLLLVDDTEAVRSSLAKILSYNGFEVATASDVNQAIRLIASREFDILLSDLHMPDPGDGLTVVSAMHHANPAALTLIFSGHPRMNAAAEAIVKQADGVLVKPMAPEALIEAILDRLNKKTALVRVVNSTATILEDETQSTISAWVARVDAEPRIITVVLTDEDRCAHLPQLFRDLIRRLRNPLPLGSRALVSSSAHQHGLDRRKQGYTAAMLVEESRMLQVSIFETLQSNLNRIDFSLVLVSVMEIADEVDSQLAQAMASYSAASQHDLTLTV